jgi:hypothetical protein
MRHWLIILLTIIALAGILFTLVENDKLTMIVVQLVVGYLLPH